MGRRSDVSFVSFPPDVWTTMEHVLKEGLPDSEAATWTFEGSITFEAQATGMQIRYSVLVPDSHPAEKILRLTMVSKFTVAVYGTGTAGCRIWSLPAAGTNRRRRGVWKPTGSNGGTALCPAEAPIMFRFAPEPREALRQWEAESD